MSHVTYFFGGAHLLLQSCGSELICIWIIFNPSIPPHNTTPHLLHVGRHPKSHQYFLPTPLTRTETTPAPSPQWMRFPTLKSFQDILRSLGKDGLGQLAQVRIEVGQLTMCGLVLEMESCWERSQWSTVIYQINRNPFNPKNWKSTCSTQARTSTPTPPQSMRVTVLDLGSQNLG